MMRDYNVGDIIQITDEKHAWFPCLLIISDVKQWGVIAYITIPKSNDGSEFPSRAFNRLSYGGFERVGTSAYALSERDE